MRLTALCLFIALAASAEEVAMVKIPSGTYVPLLKERPAARKPFEAPRPVFVGTFWMDARPVTNQEFAAFVRKNPRWSRSRIPALFAERDYLKKWKSDFDFGDSRLAKSPVVQVSWFAAKAYCEQKGKSLPTEDQWEYVADDHGQSANRSAEKILEWYGQPTPEVLPQSGSLAPNGYGVRDLFGLIWEWTLDLNRDLADEDGRASDSSGPSFFCGGAGAASARPSDYASFMRYAFRSSLHANYTLANLGFRCVARQEMP